jgi:hypothetical protein
MLVRFEFAIHGGYGDHIRIGSRKKRLCFWSAIAGRGNEHLASPGNSPYCCLKHLIFWAGNAQINDLDLLNRQPFERFEEGYKISSLFSDEDCRNSCSMVGFTH